MEVHAAPRRSGAARRSPVARIMAERVPASRDGDQSERSRRGVTSFATSHLTRGPSVGRGVEVSSGQLAQHKERERERVSSLSLSLSLSTRIGVGK